MSRSERGRSLLLRIDEVPGNVRGDDEIEFGAATRFTEASLSPDEGWLALATSSAAHGAGWLVEAGSRDPRPAAFQYGGRILIGPWSEDGRHADAHASGRASLSGLRTLSGRSSLPGTAELRRPPPGVAPIQLAALPPDDPRRVLATI